ncbi:Protein of unknown function [Gryllus bimaculatus]|nr:Protein of unknown function [Gryllus bimaculatus]
MTGVAGPNSLATEFETSRVPGSNGAEANYPLRTASSAPPLSFSLRLASHRSVDGANSVTSPRAPADGRFSRKTRLPEEAARQGDALTHANWRCEYKSERRSSGDCVIASHRRMRERSGTEQTRLAGYTRNVIRLPWRAHANADSPRASVQPAAATHCSSRFKISPAQLRIWSRQTPGLQ